MTQEASQLADFARWLNFAFESKGFGSPPLYVWMPVTPKLSTHKGRQSRESVYLGDPSDLHGSLRLGYADQSRMEAVFRSYEASRAVFRESREPKGHRYPIGESAYHGAVESLRVFLHNKGFSVRIEGSDAVGLNRAPVGEVPRMSWVSQLGERWHASWADWTSARQARRQGQGKRSYRLAIPSAPMIQKTSKKRHAMAREVQVFPVPLRRPHPLLMLGLGMMLMYALVLSRLVPVPELPSRVVDVSGASAQMPSGSAPGARSTR